MPLQEYGWPLLATGTELYGGIERHPSFQQLSGLIAHHDIFKGGYIRTKRPGYIEWKSYQRYRREDARLSQGLFCHLLQ